MPSFRVVGPGRAGGSLVAPLTAAGWESAGLLGWADDPTAAAAGIDLLVVATPDAAVGAVAVRVDPVPTTVAATVADLAICTPEPSTGPAAAEMANPVTVAGALVALAGARSESRGAHTPEDSPATDGRRCRRILTRPGQASGS